VDPVYMLIKALGNDYVVGDKAAAIRFKKPGMTTTLYARFVLSKEEIASIKENVIRVPSIESIHHVDLIDAAGLVHAMVDRKISIRRKDAV
jgi:hypothetical protein